MQDKRKAKAKEYINLERIWNDESVKRRGEPRDGSLEMAEAGLAKARALIRDASLNPNNSSTSELADSDYVPQGDIYRNPHAFHR